MTRSKLAKLKDGEHQDHGEHRPLTPAAMFARLSEAMVQRPERWGKFDDLTRLSHAMTAKWTGGISPSALGLAYADWGAHLATSPGKQITLWQEAARRALQFSAHMTQAALNPACPACIEPMARDKRFEDEAWRKMPFSLCYQSFLLAEQWWQEATTGVRGVTARNEKIVSFATRQALDVFAPSNFPLTNPVVLNKTVAEGGANLQRGAVNWLEDLERFISGEPPAGAGQYRLGLDIAATPGKVVYRNRLIELIQYAPQTKKVKAEPILITPAWIMKYYILDLNPESSLVRYLVREGYTVFMISWRNPGAESRDLGMDDYLKLGVRDAVTAIQAIVPGQGIHAFGYCLGGTLLSIAAAAYARQQGNPFKTLTLLAAQTDFTEAGELMLFINESQLAFLEDVMWERGYLDTHEMAGSFQLLRSNDLIWSRILHYYLMGEREAMNELIAWNQDGTRLPYRMHSEYLRQLFLQNDLAEGRYSVDGWPVALSDIRAPIFLIGTESDHIAPWKSVYKLHLLADTDITFALTNGGHNAGIISAPGREGRHFRLHESRATDVYLDPERWVEQTPAQEGSWWPALLDWLGRHSSGETPPPAMGNEEKGLVALADAPGGYVRQ